MSPAKETKKTTIVYFFFSTAVAAKAVKTATARSKQLCFGALRGTPKTPARTLYAYVSTFPVLAAAAGHKLLRLPAVVLSSVRLNF